MKGYIASPNNKSRTESLHLVSFLFYYFNFRAIKHLLDVLNPYSTENGGPLTLEHVTYVEGRGNLMIGYSPPGAVGTVSFVGSHLDCVPANPETWERNPFKLAQEVMFKNNYWLFN